jgi:uncharacterized protein with PIN domain
MSQPLFGHSAISVALRSPLERRVLDAIFLRNEKSKAEEYQKIERFWWKKSTISPFSRCCHCEKPILNFYYSRMD